VRAGRLALGLVGGEVVAHRSPWVEQPADHAERPDRAAP
jgi:hypothetical protein